MPPLRHLQIVWLVGPEAKDGSSTKGVDFPAVPHMAMAAKHKHDLGMWMTVRVVGHPSFMSAICHR